MRKILVKNETENTISVKYSNTCCDIDAGDRCKIEVENDDTLYIFRKRQRSVRVCVGQYLDRETIRNIWKIGPLIWIFLDLFIKISSDTPQVRVTEKKKQIFMFTVFDILTTDVSKEKTYTYRKNSDKIIVICFALPAVILLAVVSASLTMASLYAIFYEFSAKCIFMFLVTAISIWLFVTVAKYLNEIRQIEVYAEKIFNEAKEINIYKDLGWLIKYSENDCS